MSNYDFYIENLVQKFHKYFNTTRLKEWEKYSQVPYYKLPEERINYMRETIKNIIEDDFYNPKNILSEYDSLYKERDELRTELAVLKNIKEQFNE